MDLAILGLSIGMANALLAAGLVLIYQSNRVINFAHGEFGAFAVAVVLSLTRVATWNYWAAVATAIAATAVLAAIVERSIIRRLYASSRLLVLVATVGIAQLVAVVRLALPKESVGGEDRFIGGADAFPVPFTSPVWEFGRVIIQPTHIMVLVAGPIAAVALAYVMRRTTWGLAIRASAENAPRARLAGIPVQLASTLAWVMAAVLAALAAILLAPIIGFSSTEAVGLPLLMRGLAAAAVARFASVGAAFGYGLAFGLLDQLLIFYTGRSGTTDAVLLVVVLAVLVSRRVVRRRTTDADESSWRVTEPFRPLPAEVARHTNWRLLVSVLGAAGITFLAMAPVVLRQSSVLLIGTIAAVSVVALSLTVLTGWAGQVSLGQWALAGIGAVLGARILETWELPYGLVFVAVGVIGGLAALLLGLPALRLPGMFLAVVTVGLAVASTSWLFSQRWFQGTGAFPRPGWITNTAFYYLAVGFLAVAVVALRTLERSRVGRNIIAVRDNPAAAAAMGIDVVRTKLTTFVVAGVMASSAGFVWATGVQTASPNVFPAFRSLAILAATIIGGLGSISGAILGTTYYLGIPFFAPESWTLLPALSTGLGLLVLVLVLPGGLARLMFAARDRLAQLVTGLDVRPRVGAIPDALALAVAQEDQAADAAPVGAGALVEAAP